MTQRPFAVALLLAGALAGCVGQRSEPRSTTASCTPAGGCHIVRPGDTLSALAVRFGVDMRALAAANRLGPPYIIRIGQQLVVPRAPAAAGQARRDVRRPDAPPAAVRPLPRPAPPGAVAVAPMPAPRPPLRQAPLPPIPAPPGAPRLAWPADGPVSQPFGQGEGGGILIAAHPGAAVRSAAAGTVLYAGDEPTAQGRRVMIDHGGGWVTVYRHLGTLVVQPGERVAANARLGFVAPAGRALAASLGFELRQNDRPFDPLPLMPPRF